MPAMTASGMGAARRCAGRDVAGRGSETRRPPGRRQHPAGPFYRQTCRDAVGGNISLDTMGEPLEVTAGSSTLDGRGSALRWSRPGRPTPRVSTRTRTGPAAGIQPARTVPVTDAQGRLRFTTVKPKGYTLPYGRTGGPIHAGAWPWRSSDRRISISRLGGRLRDANDPCLRPVRPCDRPGCHLRGQTRLMVETARSPAQWRGNGSTRSP